MFCRAVRQREQEDPASEAEPRQGTAPPPFHPQVCSSISIRGPRRQGRGARMILSITAANSEALCQALCLDGLGIFNDSPESSRVMRNGAQVQTQRAGPSAHALGVSSFGPFKTVGCPPARRTHSRAVPPRAACCSSRSLRSSSSAFRLSSSCFFSSSAVAAAAEACPVRAEGDVSPGPRAGPAPHPHPLYLGAVGAIVLGLRGAQLSRGL